MPRRLIEKLSRGQPDGAMALFLASTLAVITPAGSAVAQSARFSCDRACLAGVADDYFEALAANDPSALPLADDVRFTETGIVKEVGEGLWQTVEGLPRFRLNLYDPETGGVGIHAVVPERGIETLLSLRLKVEAGEITEIETLVIPADTRIVGHQMEDLTEPARVWHRTIPVVERNSRFEILAAADAYFRGFETNGTPEYIPAPLLPDTGRRENGILYTNTTIGDLTTSTARSGFDAGNFQGVEVRDRRYPVVDLETGAVMSLVRFGDPMAPVSPVSLPLDRNGQPQEAPDIMVGAAWVSEIFSVAQGKILDIHAYWIPSEGNIRTPWPIGSAPTRDW